MKYTKGPWQVCPELKEPVIYIDNDKELFIVNQVGGPSKKQAEINTHLIAAAPELYESLKEVYAILKNEKRWYEKPATVEGTQWRIEQALKKAEGKK